jgi:hypothetical protein
LEVGKNCLQKLAEVAAYRLSMFAGEQTVVLSHKLDAM